MDPIATALTKQGDELAEIAKLLYGDGAWEFISKKQRTQEQNERLQARVGLATNVVGIGAGTAGTVEAVSRLREARSPKVKALEGTAKKGKLASLKPLRKIGQTVADHPVATAGALAGLQVANLAGDMVANRVLARASKKKVSKSLLAPIEDGMATKDVDIDTTFEISKVDSDKRQVFGWASVITMNGQPVVDLQDDYMAMETVEKAAYDYVKSSRKGGNMHDRDGDGPRHVSDMIESFVVTEEKKKTLGLPDEFPTGWLVGFQVNDDETWAQVKDGKRKQFSIHGSGQRVEKVLE